MYKLLVVTIQPDIIQTINEIADWEKQGFSKPKVVENIQIAQDYLKEKRVDAIGMRVTEEDKEALLAVLKKDFPSLPIIHLSSTKEKQEKVIRELKLYLNRINADYSNDSYSRDDMIVIEQNYLIHNLLSGSIHSLTELKRATNMMRFPISLDTPCMMVEMEIQDGDEYLAGRWHYGSERLEVALRNFFDNYVIGYYFGLAVVSSTTIRMVISSFEENEEQTIDQNNIDAIQEALEKIQTYLDLHLIIKSVSVIDGPKALVKPL